MDLCKGVVPAGVDTIARMDGALFQKVKEIFAEAIEKPRGERLAYVREKCGEDALLLSEIESLLEAHDSPENVIESNAFDLLEDFSTASKRYEGAEFGHYRIVREIGRGGMGTVFLAERSDGEFDQQVALKIVGQTVVSHDLERHFRRERQILAALNHPNIARLLDGGVTISGEPYLVMEYVEGGNLLDYTKDFSTVEKLNLFLKICAAIDYAHRNLVVHRDLKPSNILVTSDREPKLLDFGLARIQDEGLSSDSTQSAFRALTPAYASPEQIRGDTVTTASDIYSLGVVLYELLSGRKPFHFENKSLDEILRTITTDEAPRLSQAGPSGRVDLRGDLENIVAMALRKEPERRYGSAAAFAGDIEKYLGGRPVSARPNTISYTASKFLRRNRIAVAAAALVILTVVAGGIVSFVQFRRAEAERAKAEEISGFLMNMMLTANPNLPGTSNKGYSASINDMLEVAAKKLETGDFSGQPEVKAELEGLIGQAYADQGRFDLGGKYLRAAMETETAIYGAGSDKVLATEIRIAYTYLGKADYDQAESIFVRSLPRLREACRIGTINYTELVKTLNNFALIRRARGDSPQAESLYRETLAVIPNRGQPPENIRHTRTMLALTELDQGKFDAAESDVRGIMAEFDPGASQENIEFANTLTLLGSVLIEKEDLDEAGSNLTRAEAIYRKLLSPNAIFIYDNLRLQAQLAYLKGDYKRAAKLAGDVLENYRQNANPSYISFATALTIQGLALDKLGRHVEAESMLREAMKLRTANLPAGHFLAALTKGALGEVLTSNRQFSEAEPLLRQGLDELVTSQDAENQRITKARNRLIELYKVWRKP